MLDSNPYNWIREDDDHSPLYNRCYIWRTLNKFDPGMTVFHWEKTKMGKRIESGGSIPIAECESTVRKLRYILIDFFEYGSTEVQEFLYGAEKKSYLASMVNPWINDVTKHFQIAIALLSSENCDAYFINRMMNAIQNVFIGISYEHHVRDDASNWV